MLDVAAAVGTEAAVDVGAVVGTEAVVGMDVAAGDAVAGEVAAGTVDIGGEAVGMAGGPDTAGVVIPTTLTIPIILGVINPSSIVLVLVVVLDRFRLIQHAPKERSVTRLEVDLTEDHEGHKGKARSGEH